MIRAKTDYIVIHCSATRPNQDIGVTELRQWHKAKGWSDVGYHRIIKRDGTVQNGRALDAVGAHVSGYNARSVGVCLVGGVGDDWKPASNYTVPQWKALYATVAALVARYPGAKVVGHRDLLEKRTKECPCFDVRPWWEKVR
jgi:N-acetylmuramoyl-L-alanine amidase